MAQATQGDAGHPRETTHRERVTAALFAATAGAIAVLSIARAVVFWNNEAYLDDASGNWTALAHDLTNGVFYRPLSGPDGFGGSRYFPLHFVVNAGLMAAGVPPIRSGQILAAMAVGLLMAGTYSVLRRLGLSRSMSAACATFVLVVHPAQEALLAIKADGLAAALNVCGFAAALATPLGGGALLLAATCFALAFAAKVTTVSGAGAACLWLLVARRPGDALRLAGCTAAGVVLVLTAMYVASHGVVFEVMRASASGGAGLRDLLLAPMTLARQTRRVPETLAFVQLGCAAWLVVVLARRWSLAAPALFFVAVFAVTTIIFGSPGTDTNHLLDLHVASLIMVASLSTGRQRVAAGFSQVALVVAALAASLSLVSGLMNAGTEQRRGRLAEALALIADTSRPILAQNALVPIAAGQRPFVIDPFLLRLNTERDPAFGAPLWDAIRRQRFSAVVFERDPVVARELYKVILGERFLDEVQGAYVRAGNVGQRTIFLPRRQP